MRRHTAEFEGGGFFDQFHEFRVFRDEQTYDLGLFFIHPAEIQLFLEGSDLLHSRNRGMRFKRNTALLSLFQKQIKIIRKTGFTLAKLESLTLQLKKFSAVKSGFHPRDRRFEYAEISNSFFSHLDGRGVGVQRFLIQRRVFNTPQLKRRVRDNVEVFFSGDFSAFEETKGHLLAHGLCREIPQKRERIVPAASFNENQVNPVFSDQLIQNLGQVFLRAEIGVRVLYVNNQFVACAIMRFGDLRRGRGDHQGIGVLDQ